MVLEYDLIANLVYTILLHKLKKKKKIKGGKSLQSSIQTIIIRWGSSVLANVIQIQDNYT